MVMMTTIVIALALGGLVVGRTRFVRELNRRSFMPLVYGATAIYWAGRAYTQFGGHGRLWPNLILAAFFAAATVDSARASRISRRT
jgi:hypothetical protein